MPKLKNDASIMPKEKRKTTKPKATAKSSAANFEPQAITVSGSGDMSERVSSTSSRDSKPETHYDALIVTEKPSVAEKVAYALSDSTVAKKRYAGPVSYFIITRDGKRMCVAPAVGHILTLTEKKKNSGYPSFDIGWVESYKVNKKAAFTKDYAESLRFLGKQSNDFIVACDYDIEGSLIGYNILKYLCGSEKGRRMKFSALTKTDLLEAYATLSPQLDYGNIFAGESRHILDWYYGINLSRALMQAIRTGGMYSVLSIGRVQGPTLHLMVVKEREIRAFVSTPYWEVVAFYGPAEAAVEFFYEKGKLSAEAEALRLVAIVKQGGIVESVETAQKKIPPLFPFDLTSLQLESFSTFHFPPSKTLRVAQSLYEQSYISYPRTSSQQLPPTLNTRNIISDLSHQPAYSEYASMLISQNRTRPHNGQKTDPAHPAIYPTGIAPKGIDSDQAKLYDLIARRFLATFSEWAERENNKVAVNCSGERFIASATHTTYKGWFAIYAPFLKYEEKYLSGFTQGQPISFTDVQSLAKMTKPPKRYTPASLISELEKLGLGTKSTRSMIIDILHDRGYVRGKSLKVTDLGMSVASVLEKHCPKILDEQMTRDIEAELDRITEGSVDREKIINTGKQLLIEILQSFREHEQAIGSELASTIMNQKSEESHLGKCPACSNGLLKIIELRSRGTQFIGCTNYPNCRNSFPLPRGARVRSAKSACKRCGLPEVVISGFNGKGSEFTKCISPKCNAEAYAQRQKEQGGKT